MWFTKVETVEVVIQHSPQELYEENLAELRTLNQQLAAAEKTIVQHIDRGKDPRIAFLFRGGDWNMQARVNAMFMDPVLQKLEWNRAEVLRRRAANLAEGVRLKKECGLASY